MAGTMTLIQTPDHESVEGLNIGEIGAYDQSRSFPVSKSWTTLAYQPIDSDECEFAKVKAVIATAGNPPPNRGQFTYPLGILINSPINSAFELQIVWLFEYVGPNSRGAIRSEVDPIGFGAGIASSGTATGTKNPEATFVDTVGKVAQHIGEMSGIGVHQIAGYAAGVGIAGLAGIQRQMDRIAIDRRTGGPYLANSPYNDPYVFD
jgi:hypothetical protein